MVLFLQPFPTMSDRIRNRGSQALHFIITYNNPTHDANQLVAFLVEKRWNYIFQREIGNQGTEHY